MVSKQDYINKSYGLVTDRYPIHTFPMFCEYAEDLTCKTKNLTQVDGWGCVSATAAFIINRSIGEQCVTAADMDVELGRPPKEPADPGVLAKWLLDKGFHLDMYSPPHPLDTVIEDYAEGRISFTEYLKKYEEIYGKVPDEEIERFICYCEDTLVPSKKRENPFAGYIQRGTATSNKQSFSSQLLAPALRDDVQMFTYINSGFGIHAVSIFRPRKNFPAMVFVPSTEDDGGSWVTPFDSELRNDMMKQNEPFSFISNPDNITKRDLGL